MLHMRSWKAMEYFIRMTQGSVAVDFCACYVPVPRTLATIAVAKTAPAPIAKRVGSSICGLVQDGAHLRTRPDQLDSCVEKKNRQGQKINFRD